MSEVVLGHPHGRPFYWFVAALSSLWAIAFIIPVTGVTGVTGWLLPVHAAVAAISTLAAWQAMERLFHPGRAFARSVALPDATRRTLGLLGKIANGLCIATLLAGYSLIWFGNAAWKDGGQDLRTLAFILWLLQFFLDDLPGKRRA
jgi:hypothetical protein